LIAPDVAALTFTRTARPFSLHCTVSAIALGGMLYLRLHQHLKRS